MRGTAHPHGQCPTAAGALVWLRKGRWARWSGALAHSGLRLQDKNIPRAKGHLAAPPNSTPSASHPAEQVMDPRLSEARTGFWGLRGR